MKFRMGTMLACAALTMGAHAAWADVSCTAQSNGLVFNSSDYDLDSARQEVIDACQANWSTNNDDCVQSAVCAADVVTPVDPGLTTCDVTTSLGQYEGTGWSEGQATAAARDQCLHSETSFACNAGSVVCRN